MWWAVIDLEGTTLNVVSISRTNCSAPGTAGEFGPQQFFRDFPAVLDEVRKIDGRHAAGTEFALYGAAADKGGGDMAGSPIANVGKTLACRKSPTRSPTRERLRTPNSASSPARARPARASSTHCALRGRPRPWRGGARPGYARVRRGSGREPCPARGPSARG